MNATPHQQHGKWARVKYFFPFRLILLHLKKNHFLLFLWVFMFSIVSGLWAKNVGVPQLFLLPEYRGATGLISFSILGFALGGFITGFNLYTYIMHGYRFPFIATLSRPFHKFSLNNFLLPGLFIVVYLINSARYQILTELIPAWKVALNLLCFVIGIAIFQTFSYFYFLYTNKEAHAYGKGSYRSKDHADNFVTGTIHHRFRWLRGRKGASVWHVETYLSGFRKISLARESKHYSKQVLEQVFDQNHINASRFQLALVISFLLVGSLRSFELFVIPAAASCMLFFTMLLMLVSAIHSWLRGWTLTLLIAFLIALNFFYQDWKIIKLESRAIGLNYDAPPARYDLLEINPTDQMVEADRQLGMEMLQRRLHPDTSSTLPKLVIINCSGGGTRSAFWTMKTLAHLDSLIGPEIMDNCVLMTGASGGMLGASYMRELYWREKMGEEFHFGDSIHAERMGRDLLNPIILSVATNDWFLRYQKVHDNQYSYTKDRATAFEEQLVRNTNGIFDRRLRDYAEPEQQGTIPMMVLSPTIVNDGRRMLIASSPISYLAKCNNINGVPNDLPESVEFSRLFHRHEASNLRFVTALRMNATFPYVFPLTTLPSEPPLEVMDAGVRDNFGWKTTMQYLRAFQDWIEQNTSGVIIVQIRDLPKHQDLSENDKSLLNNFSAPIGGIYGNLTKTQDYNMEQTLVYLRNGYKKPIDVVSFQLFHEKTSHISLSWHLTRAEKLQICRALTDPYFMLEMNRLKTLLKSD